MSLLAGTQIPKPTDEQAFERACIPLWRGLLKDPNVQKNARRGQRQDGVDLYGMRNRDPSQYVGIQCKLKSEGKELSETEVRKEVGKALNFKPALREYFIVTTADDDGEMHELARIITAELHAEGRQMLVYVWGWKALEERIYEDDEARRAFDPSFGPFSGRILENTEQILVGQAEVQSDITQVKAELSKITATLSGPPGDATIAVNIYEAHLDTEIDSYRDLANAGKPKTALPLLERLLAQVQSTASGRILFRAKANIGSCLLALGEQERAAAFLMEAYEHSPKEPKAIANKAFSLLLLGQWQELLAWGKEALASDPANEGLAGFLIQATRFDCNITDPLQLIPDALRWSVPVTMAYVDFLRHREMIPEWWQAARSALAVHPNDRYALRFAAEADLDEVLRDPIFGRTRLLTVQQRARVAAAAAQLKKQWDEARASEGIIQREHAAICSNVIAAYHVLDDIPAAIEVARQGLTLLPDDVEIANRAAVAAIDGEDETFAGHALRCLPPGPDATVLAFRFHSGRRDWAEVVRISQTQAEYIPEVERCLIVTAGRLAQLKLTESRELEHQIEVIASDVTDDPRASIVVADFARAEGFERISESSYQAALQHIRPDSHIAARQMVARHAASRGEAKVVADLLDRHIAEDYDSEPLRALARAFVNDQPIRQRAVQFFARLPTALKQHPFYLHAEALLHYNRGALKEAEIYLRRAIKDSHDLTCYLTLFSTLRRGNRTAEIKPILIDLNLATIRGTPGQKMYLAQNFLVMGMSETALSLGYDVLQGSKNDPQAALRYFGLMMLDPNGLHLPRPTAVEVDVWVKLENADGESYAFVIEEGSDRPAEGILSTNHAVAAAAMGLNIGNTFTINTAIGTEATWRVAEIKHKYLHALHDVMANFQTRFPDEKGFYKLRLRDNDIQPALDEVRRASERNRALADLCLLQHLPMAMVASHLGGDSIGFANYLRSLGHDIKTAIGSVPERDALRASVMEYQGRGAVLDAYTAWTAATMDVFDILTGVFGQLVIPQSNIDELRSQLELDQFSPDGSLMTIGWHEGQFIRQEFTREDIAARNQFITRQITKIESACEIVPPAAPDEPTRLANVLIDTFGADVLDAAHLGSCGYLLLSEDLYYREVAKEALGVGFKSACLQSVLSYARESALIPEDRYARAIVNLAQRRHGHVWLDHATLYQVWRADQSDELSDFAALAEFVGTRDADMRSHLRVVSSFLDRIWQEPKTSAIRVMQATGILLGRLTRYRPKDWSLYAATIFEWGDWRLREYVDQWVKGHFLDLNQFRHARRYINAVAGEARLRILLKQKVGGRLRNTAL